MPGRLEPIVKTALLGTERRPLTTADLSVLGREAHDTDPAQIALEALAEVQLRSKAGFLLANAPADMPLPAPVDERPVCNAIACRLLRQMLAGQHHLALPEFVDLMLRSGKKLPPEMLPDILHKGLDNRLLFNQLEPILGPVGYWLAQQHLRWQALMPDAQTDWFTGSLEDRLRLLRNMRLRSPLAALAWLEDTWQQESSLHQVEFLELLIIGLSEFDEPLLQRAASDKKDKVRLTALRLLEVMHLSPTEKLQLATARHPDFFPASVTKEYWPKTLRLALLTTMPFAAELLTQAWLRLLGQLATLDRTTPDFLAVEEAAKIVAYKGDLALLEPHLQISVAQMPTETGQMLVNILSFRQQILTILVGEN